MAELSATNLWIGLNSLNQDGFYWTDGKARQYTNWGYSVSTKNPNDSMICPSELWCKLFILLYLYIFSNLFCFSEKSTSSRNLLSKMEWGNTSDTDFKHQCKMAKHSDSTNRWNKTQFFQDKNFKQSILIINYYVLTPHIVLHQENCVVMSNNAVQGFGKWLIKACNNTYGFVCTRKVGQFLVFFLFSYLKDKNEMTLPKTTTYVTPTCTFLFTL